MQKSLSRTIRQISRAEAEYHEALERSQRINDELREIDNRIAEIAGRIARREEACSDI